MAGLPTMQKIKMEALRAAENNGQPAVVPVKPKGPTAVVSMVPDGERPRPPGTTAPAPAAIDPNDFAVDPVPPAIETPPAPSAAVPEPVIPAPRPGDDDPTVALPRPKEGTPEYAYWLKWKALAGMFERTRHENQQLQDSLNSLGTRFDAVVAKLDALAANPPPAPQPAQSLDLTLTEIERDTYKDAIPVVEKLVKAALEQAGVSALKTEVSEIKANTGSLAKTQIIQDERAFFTALRAAIPNMDDMIAQGVKDGTWPEYMGKRVPYSGLTFREALMSAHERRDLEQVKEIISGYQPTPRPTIDELATPSRRADNIDPVATAQRKPVLKWSERVKASSEFTKGRLSRERMDQINQLYTEAEKESRINYNA